MVWDWGILCRTVGLMFSISGVKETPESTHAWRKLTEVLCSQMVNMPQILPDILTKLISKLESYAV